jgi:hypothetical protein
MGVIITRSSRVQENSALSAYVSSVGELSHMDHTV